MCTCAHVHRVADMRLFFATAGERYTRVCYCQDIRLAHNSAGECLACPCVHFRHNRRATRAKRRELRAIAAGNLRFLRGSK